MVRFRLGMTMNINEDMDVYGRLASGSGAEPTSTNFTLGENWAKSNLWLERAYMDWHPNPLRVCMCWLVKWVCRSIRLMI